MFYRGCKKFLLGFTLVEVLVVMGILTFLVGAILTFLTSSDRAWQIGQDKLTEQRQARLAMDTIATFLRRSNPQWDNTHIISSSESNQRIDFYIPYFYTDCCPNQCQNNTTCQDTDGVFHTRGEISGLSKVTFKLLPDVAHPAAFALWIKEGIRDARRIAGSIVSISFYDGCRNCAADAAVNPNSSYVNVTVVTQEQVRYTLQSKIALRNKNLILPVDIPVEEPAEGEF